MGIPIAEPIHPAPVIIFTETCVAAETTIPDRSIPAMIVRFPSARHRAQTTPTPMIGSTIIGVTPARLVVSTKIETSRTDVMIPIVVVRTIALVCRRA